MSKTRALMKRGRGGRRAGAGRKPSKTKTRVVALRLPESDYPKLVDKAKRSKVPLSRILSDMIRGKMTVREIKWPQGTPRVVDVE